VYFEYPRTGFSLAVFNAGIFYQLAYQGISTREVRWRFAEHYLAPSFNSFNSPTNEGMPPGTLFMGIRTRSAVPGTPARVTIS
jgi:hypothetical protein